ncbi:MAG: thiamine phosphate synthase [Acidobacteria bacterium]|nr:thiamine phosphate synthase [Acidobacteriota bacterium]
MQIYLISDRRALFAPTESFSEDQARKRLLRLGELAALMQVDYFQLREKDLSPRTCFEVAQELAALFHNTSTRLLVNDRVDIALAAGAQGVHLTSISLLPAHIRPWATANLTIGISTHTQEELHRTSPGATFAVCGPVFETPGKPRLGLEPLKQIIHTSPVPVFALGGITVDNAVEIKQTGAVGVAGIRLFAQAAFQGDTEFGDLISHLKAL